MSDSNPPARMTTDQATRILSIACTDPGTAQRLHDDPETELKTHLGVPANPKDIEFFRSLPLPAPGQTTPDPKVIDMFQQSIGEL